MPVAELEILVSSASSRFRTFAFHTRRVDQFMKSISTNYRIHLRWQSRLST